MDCCQYATYFDKLDADILNGARKQSKREILQYSCTVWDQIITGDQYITRKKCVLPWRTLIMTGFIETTNVADWK